MAPVHRLAAAGFAVTAMFSPPLWAHGDEPGKETGEAAALKSYTDEHVRGFTLKGFRLGMPLDEAEGRFGVKIDPQSQASEHLTAVTTACGDNRIANGFRLMAIGPEQERYSLLFDADGLLQSVNVTLRFPAEMDMTTVVSSIGSLYGTPTARSLRDDGTVGSLLWAAEKPGNYESDPSTTPSSSAYLVMFVAPVNIRFDQAKQIFEQADVNLLSLTLNGNPGAVDAPANCR